jgi:hypothetical protein
VSPRLFLILVDTVVGGIDFGCGGAYAFRQLKRSQGVFMADKKTEKCAHPGCNCPAAPGSKYLDLELQDGRHAQVILENLDGDFDVTGAIRPAPEQKRE